MRPVLVSFSAAGAALARRLAPALNAEVGTGDAKTLIPRLFAAGRPIVGICAAGILIRLVAARLGDKFDEPPVVALSVDGAHVVPLLGGHRGANALARDIAALTGGMAAVTTGSEGKFTRALDAPPPGWALADREAAKPAMARALAGAAIRLVGEAPWLYEAGYAIADDGEIIVSAGETASGPGLRYHPQTLVAGIGGERGVAASEVIDLITQTLAEKDFAPKALAALATIDLKGDEAGFHAAAWHFGVPLRLFTPEELAREAARLPNPSAVVERAVGVPGVAEAAALKAGELWVEKRKSARVTCAIGRAPGPLDIESFGRARGALHIVGVGPGDAPSRTAAAVAALDAASDWVGYGLYLDLVADLRHGQAEHRFALGDETARVRHALELAGAGKTVALLSSGDPQIFAMASLAYELLESEFALSPAARRVAVAVHPGVSAFQAASAAAGALIGHDFACLSLSDLLTPTEVIRRRLAAAAAGDFVVALYNPRSARRTDLLDAAKALFLTHRPPATPVVVARNLGRADEDVVVTTLADFAPESVDMLTIVMIGASGSRGFRRGDGSFVAFTPRGYAQKPEHVAQKWEPVLREQHAPTRS